MITYHETSDGNVKVKLDNTLVGTIKNFGMIGFVYVPKGQRTGGQMFKTLDTCKASLQ